MRSFLFCLLAIAVCSVSGQLNDVNEKLIKNCDVEVSGSVKGVKFSGTCDDKNCTLPTDGNVTFQVSFAPNVSAEFLFVEVDIEHETEIPKYNISILMSSDTLESCNNDNVKFEGGDGNCSVQAGKTYTLTITNAVGKMLPGAGNVTIGIATITDTVKVIYFGCFEFPIVIPGQTDSGDNSDASSDNSGDNSSPATSPTS